MKWCVLALGLLLCGCNTAGNGVTANAGACGVLITGVGTHGCSVTLY